MNVILLESVENVGGIGDLVTVKPGFGRNYLLPQGKAALATPENMSSSFQPMPAAKTSCSVQWVRSILLMHLRQFRSKLSAAKFACRMVRSTSWANFRLVFTCTRKSMLKLQYASSQPNKTLSSRRRQPAVCYL